MNSSKTGNENETMSIFDFHQFFLVKTCAAVGAGAGVVSLSFVMGDLGKPDLTQGCSHLDSVTIGSRPESRDIFLSSFRRKR